MNPYLKVILKIINFLIYLFIIWKFNPNNPGELILTFPYIFLGYIYLLELIDGGVQ